MKLLLVSNVDSIIELIIGVILILFRKQIVRINVGYSKKWMGPKKLKKFNEIAKSGKFHYFNNIQKIGYVIVGIICIAVGVQGLFFPAAFEYIGTTLGLTILFLLSAGMAGFVVVKLINPFLNRKIDRYISERHEKLRLHSNSPLVRERCKADKSLNETDDPFLLKMKKKAMIYGILWLIGLTMVISVAFYIIIKATGS